jgi:REP element-mobilizing transposase RayT
MPRRLREEVAGGVHHVFARGNGRQPVFVDDHDRRRYLDLCRGVVGRQRWRCLAYCLMENHVHLLLETPEPNLGEGMRRLHGTYVQTFNERHHRVGPLFQSRYGSRLLKDDGHLWLTAAYIARNPVEAGVVDSADDWEWSSHPLIARGRAPAWIDADRLLSFFAPLGGDPLRRYLDLVKGSGPVAPGGLTPAVVDHLG